MKLGPSGSCTTGSMHQHKVRWGYIDFLLLRDWRVRSFIINLVWHLHAWSQPAAQDMSLWLLLWPAVNSDLLLCPVTEHENKRICQDYRLEPNASGPRVQFKLKSLEMSATFRIFEMFKIYWGQRDDTQLRTLQTCVWVFHDKEKPPWLQLHLEWR